MKGKKEPRTVGRPYGAGDAGEWTPYNCGTNRITHFQLKSKEETA